jgi:hypothetical protein
MATIPLTNLILEDRWPGQANTAYGMPTEGWDNTRDNFKMTASTDVPRYPLGTKIAAYSCGTAAPGWYTMIYLMYHDFSSIDISGDFSHGNMFVSHYDGSKAVAYNVDNSTVPYYVVGRCYTTVAADWTLGSPVAVACASVTADSSVVLGQSPYEAGYGDAYGWFWCGGVCPVADATKFQGKASSLKGADMSVRSTSTRGAVYLDHTGQGVLGTFDASIQIDVTNGVARQPSIGWICTSAA